MGIAEVLAELRRDIGFMSNVTAWETLPARLGCMAEIPTGLHPALTKALHDRGIAKLYSHQAEAVERTLLGESIAIVTPTASGKTLCYTLPVLHALLNDPNATALYLFPTKALAHDQLAEIDEWIAATGGGLQVSAYDGDTPTAQRGSIRGSARLIFTNPDMLHAAILPYHGSWERVLSGLRYVVIDEMHGFRGVFGSHVANVLRRLRRLAAHYGSCPQFLLASATIANPKQLAEVLTEQPVRVIDRSGAPQGEKHIILYAPPLYDPIQGLRRSSVLETQELAARFLRGGLQTIIFGRARMTVELLLSYVRERLQVVDGDEWKEDSNSARDSVRGYRGGYLPEERRQIEAGLRSGTVRGVVATNALELGIDIGQLEAALICGYPGTIAAAWQQWGRVGRKSAASIAVLVATAGALDQYIVNHPRYLLHRTPEQAFANADNLALLMDHMRCAAFELPFAKGEPFGNSPFTAEVLDLLVDEASVRRFGNRLLWSGDGYPARRFGLRSLGGEPVVVQAGNAKAVEPAKPALRDDSSTVIGEVDATSAPFLVHEGAVYLHEGRSYLVERLDLKKKTAWVCPAAVDHYTEASTENEIEVLSVHESRASGGARLGHGELLVTSRVTQYRRVKRYTHENLGVLPLDYPPTILDTAGYWLDVTAEAQLALMEAGDWYDSPNDYGPDWQEQRARTRDRDGYRCAECGAHERGCHQHDVHHQIPFRAFGYVPGLNRNDQAANRLNNLVLLCRRCHQRMEAGVRARTGMDGVAYACGNLAPLHLMCDRRDIDVSVVRQGEGTGAASDCPLSVPAPRIYVFERMPAGIGFSVQLYERHDLLIAAAAELIRNCGCRYGCPACVGPVLLVGDEKRPVLESKRLALALLATLADGF